MKNRSKKRRGAALVEYALLIAGVALISLAAVSIFGHKTSDMIAAVASVLPGAHNGDNAAIQSGHLIETNEGTATAPIALDLAGIQTNSGTDRLGINVAGTQGTATGFGGLVTETGP